MGPLVRKRAGMWVKGEEGLARRRSSGLTIGVRSDLLVRRRFENQMSQLLLQYTFDEGRVENPDGTFEGQLVGGAFEAVRVDVPGWGPVRSAVRFDEGTILLAPVPPELARAGSFTVGVVVLLDRAPSAPMSLLAAVEPPISLTVEPAAGGVRAVAAVLSRDGWCICASEPMPAAGWTALSISFTGRELVLLENGRVAARSSVAARLAEGERPGPLFVGTPAESGVGRLRGALGGVRAWDGIPDIPGLAGREAPAVAS